MTIIRLLVGGLLLKSLTVHCSPTVDQVSVDGAVDSAAQEIDSVDSVDGVENAAGGLFDFNSNSFGTIQSVNEQSVDAVTTTLTGAALIAYQLECLKKGQKPGAGNAGGGNAGGGKAGGGKAGGGKDGGGKKPRPPSHGGGGWPPFFTSTGTNQKLPPVGTIPNLPPLTGLIPPLTGQPPVNTQPPTSDPLNPPQQSIGIGAGNPLSSNPQPSDSPAPGTVAGSNDGRPTAQRIVINNGANSGAAMSTPWIILLVLLILALLALLAWWCWRRHQQNKEMDLETTTTTTTTTQPIYGEPKTTVDVYEETTTTHHPYSTAGSTLQGPFLGKFNETQSMQSTLKQTMKAPHTATMKYGTTQPKAMFASKS